MHWRQVVFRFGPELPVPRWRPWSPEPSSPTVCDDPRVCPPQIPGQLSWAQLPRTLTIEHAHRITDRSFPELPAVAAAVDQMAAERQLSEAWKRLALHLARLALASREADEQLVREQDIARLPELRGPMVELFRRAGLLRRRPNRWHLALHPHAPAVSCEHCLSWSGTTAKLCSACKNWNRFNDTGECRRCHRVLPLSLGRCRRCRVVQLEQTLADAPVLDQLWFGGEIDIYANKTGRDLKTARRHQARRARAARRHWPEHLIDPAQLELFPAPERDWTAIRDPGLLKITPEAQHLVDELDRLARAQSWSSATRKKSLRTLRVLLAWLGTDTPIPERDVYGAGSITEHYNTVRVAGFLQTKGLLAPDSQAVGTDEASVHLWVGQAPAQFQADLRAWVSVLRGEGKRPSPAMPWNTIRGYMLHVVAVLPAWDHLTSLNEVTEKEVKTAAVNYSYLTGLRSLFRALRRERRIFRDPARNVHLTAPVRVPRPIPADRLKGLLDQVPGIKDKLALVLMAVYAVRPKQVAEIRLDDLNRSTGRLRIRRPNRLDHEIYLDDFALQLVKDWLIERHQRWPLSTNPYLIVSPITALHVDRPAVGPSNFKALRDRIGINPTQLRQDRFLDEARETADPIQLMRLFGITSHTAIHYVRTAYPERFTIDPTEA
ncbi:hypothetical protein LK08_23325 [Streptomyces sp. MUSC 125]|uniref:site-specific integrase n=1 Tax=Streptomyces sp. MUSC 125 TaxID=1428624 RepID=UPI00057C48D0|nr:hypothetical protein [Streptomyces sp. MUSC 125]KIE24693.1 hypothetical protein LK08_23325 [Streptomyces sp. MUSC 125]